MKPFCLALIIASCSLFSSLALAQPSGPPPLVQGDYEEQSGDWNGLRDFLTLAQGAGVSIERLEALDYDDLDPSRPLILVYPRQALRHRSLSRFVIDGGRILLADDFGASEEFLRRLDVDRVSPIKGTLPHERFLQNNPALPILRAKGLHPLLEGVETIVANHPSVLYNIGGPVLSFDVDGGLVYDMNLGEGKVIVVSDSSMMINHMVTLGDNEVFWQNAVTYLCGELDPCTPRMVVGDFEQRGAFGGEEGLGKKEEIVESVDSFNKTVAEVMEQFPASKLYYYLGILLAVGLAVYLYTIFPMRRTRPYSAYLSDRREQTHAPQSEFDWNLARFAHGSSAMNYALPVSILKEVFEELFLKELGAWDRDHGERPKIQELARLYADRYLVSRYPPAEVRRESARLADLLGTLAKVPTRHRVFLDSDTYFSERDLLGIHDLAIHYLDHMGLKQAYERRTRTHI